MNKADRIKTDAKRQSKQRTKWATRLAAGKPYRGFTRHARRYASGKTPVAPRGLAKR